MHISGQENIAAVFGVAPKTIVEWQEQGFPVAVRGRPGVPSEFETEAKLTSIEIEVLFIYYRPSLETSLWRVSMDLCCHAHLDTSISRR